MKTNNEVIDEIIEEQLGVHREQVTPEASLIADLDMDSLDFVELVMALEEAFDLELDDEDVEKWLKVADIHKAYAGAKQIGGHD